MTMTPARTSCPTCRLQAATAQPVPAGVGHRLQWLGRKVERGEHLNDEEIDWLVAHHPAFVRFPGHGQPAG